MKKFSLLIVGILLVAISCSRDVVKSPTLDNSKALLNQQLEEDLILPPKFNRTPIDLTFENQEASRNAERKKTANRVVATQGNVNGTPTQLWEQLYASNWDSYGNHINLVFIAEGFTESELPYFNTLVDSLLTYVDGSISNNPNAVLSFKKTGLSAWDVYVYRTISNESGISVQGGTTVDTYWNIYRNADGLARLTGISSTDRDRMSSALNKAPNGYLKGEMIYPVFIVNTGTYAGSGEFEAMNGNNTVARVPVAIITKSSELGWFRQLFLHEFGHTYGNLDDEYIDPEYDSIVMANGGYDWTQRYNVTDDTINNKKWTNYYEVGNVENCTTAYNSYGFACGNFLGARYSNNFYRPMQNSMMRALNGGWSGYHKKLFNNRRTCNIGGGGCSSCNCGDLN